MENDKQLNVNLPNENAEGRYSNIAMITHSQSEFVIDFVLNVPGKPPTIVSRIVESPIGFKALVKAMNRNLETYEKENGEILTQEGKAETIILDPGFRGPVQKN